MSVVDEYTETVLVRSISTLDGVANVEIYGQAHPAVRIQADPNALAVRGISLDQLATAIKSANVNLATGSISGASRSAVIEADGQLLNAEQFLPQIIAHNNGAPVRLSDVATVIDGVENPFLSGTYNGRGRRFHRRQPAARLQHHCDCRCDQGDAAPIAGPDPRRDRP